MSASVTRAPQSASTSAIAKPSPLAAPVTTARTSRTSNRRPSTSAERSTSLPLTVVTSSPLVLGTA